MRWIFAHGENSPLMCKSRPLPLSQTVHSLDIRIAASTSKATKLARWPLGALFPAGAAANEVGVLFEADEAVHSPVSAAV